MNNKGFTILETLIVIIILGILSSVLIGTYIKMSDISYKISQEKNISREFLMFSQIIENYSQKNTINYEKYKEEYDINYLTDNNGFVENLYLTGSSGEIIIYSTGECYDINKIENRNFEKKINCWLEVNNNGNIIKITDPNKSIISNIYFKIIPYAKLNDYYNDETLKCKTNFFACINQKGFWVLGKIYNTNYRDNRKDNNSLVIQNFFNLNQ